MINTPNTAARLVLATLTTLGATIPKPVAAANAKATKILNGAGQLAPAPGALATAVADAIDNDRHPAEDADVQNILTAQQISGEGVHTAIAQLAADHIREAMTQHAAALFTALQPPFKSAATTLATTHQQLGGLPLDDTTAVVGRGGDAAEQWGRARHALAQLDQVNVAWHQLATITRTAPTDWPVLRITAMTHTDWVRLDQPHRRLTAWDLLTEGFTLNLADPDTYKQRRAVITRGQQEVEARHEGSPDRRVVWAS